MNGEQFQAIIWLRWRLTRNRFARAGTVNAVLAVLMLAGLLVSGLVAGVAGFLAGALTLAKLSPQILLLVWDGVMFAFLVFWLSGLLVEIQRSESIDLPKLMHLPLTLQQVFVFNYIASHFTPSLVLFLPGMLGLAAGLAFGAGPLMMLLAPLILAFIFMLSAWTYCLRGWLAALMVNKRRRRTIIVWTTVAFVLVFQLPNLLLNSRTFNHRVSSQPGTPESPGAPPAARRRDALLPESALHAHLAVPPGWVGYGAMALKMRQAGPALAATAAGCLIGALGLRRAYRLTLRFYSGANGETEPGPVPQPAQRSMRGRLMVEWSPPWLAEDTAALALATFRSLLRAPELKMALIAPVILVAVMGSMHFARLRQAPPETLTVFAATGAAVMATFSFSQTLSNLFGLDRSGFRTLILLPTTRRQILLAKNLAVFPFVGTVGLLLLLLAGFLLHLSWTVLLAGLLQVPTAFLLFALVGNLASILVPYRLAQGTLQARKVKPVVFLTVFISMLALPVIMTPVLLPPALQLLFAFLGWAPRLPVDLLASLCMLCVIAWLYWQLLPLEGRLLQRREQAVLREVTEEVE